MVVCDVTSENKEVIKQLEEAHVSVQHRSRTKKDSSDEVLRQQMRKVVGTSGKPGRIVLISGDSDFSTDIHSFRFTKLWEVVLIHNAAAKEALKITATHSLPFEAVMEKRKKAQEKKENKKKPKAVLKCKSGHPLTQRPPEDSGWFCSASKDPGGCRRALAEKALASGGISSSRYPSYSCLPCAYRICDLCFQTKTADVADQKKKPEKKKDKKENAPKKVKKEMLPTP